LGQNAYELCFKKNPLGYKKNPLEILFFPRCRTYGLRLEKLTFIFMFMKVFLHSQKIF
jgi:hypothetical protein